MSLNVKGQSCPICHAYLFEEDDIVYCPTCGAPHHKDCYLTIGHCGLEELHGTENQYDRTKVMKEPKMNDEQQGHTENTEKKGTVMCPRCHNEYNFEERVCPSCGMPNIAFGRNVIMLDSLGGVPKEYDLGDGVTAIKAAKFVNASTMRVIPKFARMKAGQKTFFNVWALFFPGAHFAFRKMYKNAIIVTVLQIIADLLALPFTNVLNTGVTENMQTYEQMFNFVSEKMNEVSFSVLLLFGIGTLFNLVIRIISAFTADKLYYKHCISTVKDIETNGEDIEENYRKKGGVSLLWFFAALLASEYLPVIILSFLK